MKRLITGIGMLMLGCMIFQWISSGPESLLGSSQRWMRGQIEHVRYR